MMTYEAFEALLESTFPDITEQMAGQFRMMEAGYRDWNAKINVISRKDIDSLYDHHVLHSLAIARYLMTMCPQTYSLMKEPGTEVKVLDLGTGGGFPGIPLAVLFPEVKFTLCDSVGKKTIVAREISTMLGLKNVEIVNARAESLGGGFDFIVSRAVTTLPEFYNWVRRKFTRSILYLKGGDINEEIYNLMSRERLRKGSVSTWQVDSWLKDPYFEGKFVIDIKA
jgi:16S rRNA (guanine527-N7)-methyltransferase